MIFFAIYHEPQIQLCCCDMQHIVTLQPTVLMAGDFILVFQSRRNASSEELLPALP